jgi:hypothetical protein
MNDLVAVAATDLSRAVNTPFKTETEVREYFVRIINQKALLWKAAFVGGSVIGFAILWPLIKAAVLAGFGLAVIGTMLVAAGVAKRYLPLLWRKVENHVIELQQCEANRHLAALKAEARKNPIDTLQTEYLAMEKQRQGISEANSAFMAVTESYGSELGENKRHDPSVDYSEEERTYAEMQKVCAEQGNDLHEFVVALVAFKRKIDEASRKWNLQLKANTAFALLDEAERSSKMRDILVQVSFDEVRTQYSGLFAKMNTRARELAAARTLRIGHSVVDVSSINTPTIKENERVTVR